VVKVSHLHSNPSASRRTHDLRHSFTVASLLDFYRDGGDVQARLPLLSTWLGHVDPKSTYWYLQAIPELLALAAGRLEQASRDQRYVLVVGFVLGQVDVGEDLGEERRVGPERFPEGACRAGVLQEVGEQELQSGAVLEVRAAAFEVVEQPAYLPREHCGVLGIDGRPGRRAEERGFDESDVEGGSGRAAAGEHEHEHAERSPGGARSGGAPRAAGP